MPGELRAGDKFKFMSNTNKINKSFWDFKSYEESEWFKKLIIALLFLGFVYIFLHFITGYFFPEKKYEFEYVKLDKDQMQQVNRIYFNSLDSSGKKIDSANLNKPAINPNVRAKKDSLDSLNNSKALLLAKNIRKYQFNDSCNCTQCSKEEKVICYLWNEFNHKLDTSQLYTIAQYISCASPTEATSFLSNERFSVKSYFWLTGPLVYWEIIFWSWFGVISSILFNLGVISKKSTTDPTDPTTYFDSSEIPSQIAKLLYAPACTLVIVFGYNFFSGENLVDLNSSKGVIVFAFIGGFYSSRLVSFLDRLKELLLPTSSTDGKKGSAPSLKNIVVQLQLDSTIENLWDSINVNLDSLDLTLQEEHSTQQAIAFPIDKNRWPLFIFDFIKPGTYTMKALWTTKHDGKLINLKAEQKIEMKDTDQSVTLKLLAANTEEGELNALQPDQADNGLNQDAPPGAIAPPADASNIETPVDIDINKKSEDNE